MTFPEIENGVRTDLLTPDPHNRKREGAICLGRICPEKGFHIALRAARAGLEMLLAGQISAFPEHEAYFADAVLPNLDQQRRYIGPIGFEEKRRLLRTARCLVVPSQAPEMSSLVAREALACGTPVVAFSRGALAEVVEDGRTGFLVQSEEQLGDAMYAAASIDPEACRRVAEERFSAERMIKRYIGVYRRIVEGRWPLSQVA